MSLDDYADDGYTEAVHAAGAAQRELETTGMPWIYDDGGRAAAGYLGTTRDCVARAVAIATGMSYQEAYDGLNAIAGTERITKRHRKRSNARTGIRKATTRRYMTSIGWTWTPTMLVGQGCTVHLAPGELPMGILIAKLSRHTTAVIDGIIHDTYDPSRSGRRCVYGYYSKLPVDRNLREDTPEYRRAYEKGWRYSASPTATLDYLDGIGAPAAQYDGYADRGADREKWHMLRCTDHDNCP